MAEAPVIDQEHRFFWRAFQELSTDRPTAMSGISPIPFTAILNYANEYELQGYERDEFIRVIRAVDSRCNVLVSMKSKKEAKNHKR